MKLCYFILIIFIAKIYSVSHIPPACTKAEGECSEDADCGADKKLVNGKCYTADANCAEYNPNYDACYKCTASTHTFSSDHTKCVAVISGCSVYGNDGTCTTCNPGYTQSGNTCTCSGEGQTPDTTLGICKKIRGCAVYKGDATCKKCESTYGLAADGSSCTQCTNQISNDGTVPCFTAKPNCQEHDENGNCIRCNTGYLKSDGTCDACNGQHDVQDGIYCYTDDGGSIENCIEYSGSTCVKCKNHMETDGSACTPCYSPYVTVGMYCLPPGTTLDPHCTGYSNGVCRSCDDTDKYEPDGTSCVLKCKGSNGGGGDDGGNGGNGGDNKGNGEASNSNAMKLNIIFMAIMLMIVA